MSERHAYGTSCGCVSRRIFVLVSCLVLAVLCYLQLGRWFLELHLLSPATEDANQRLHCTGTECLEVWSCYGMRETTYHLREPFVTAVGAVTLPLGVYGALQGSQWHLQAATLYLILDAALRFGIIVADVVYVETCGSYPFNVVDQILLETKGLVYKAIQEKLSVMSSFGVDNVDAATAGFYTMAFYLAYAGLWLLVVGYLASQAQLLGRLLETGPLGLGVHYGINQWDEEFHYAEYKRARALKESARESRFIRDATLPDPELKPLDPSPGFAVSGHRHGAGYGATGGGPEVDDLVL
mmetsp:Transcript_91064/g.237230  ORF Transcript_91064/g.237230 Transcript_91064/m.237230 type:complete len:297 (-) Transcript_91064:66-956(-)